MCVLICGAQHHSCFSQALTALVSHGAAAPEQQAAGAQVRVLGEVAAPVLAELHERAQVLGGQRDGRRHGRLPHAQHLGAQRELRPALDVGGSHADEAEIRTDACMALSGGDSRRWQVKYLANQYRTWISSCEEEVILLALCCSRQAL